MGGSDVAKYGWGGGQPERIGKRIRFSMKLSKEGKKTLRLLGPKSSQCILWKSTNCKTARSISPISETQEPDEKFEYFKKN